MPSDLGRFHNEPQRCARARKQKCARYLSRRYSRRLFALLKIGQRLKGKFFVSVVESIAWLSELVANASVKVDGKLLVALANLVNNRLNDFNASRFKGFCVNGLCNCLFSCHAVLGFFNRSNLVAVFGAAALIRLRALGVIPKSCAICVACFRLCPWI